MLARVTTFEGGTADSIRSAADEMRSNIGEGPPEGLKSVGITMLVDPEGGKVMMIGLFETEDDLNESEPVLKQMNPPEGMGSMASKDVYEVAAEARM
jgi:hypothetical protein